MGKVMHSMPPRSWRRPTAGGNVAWRRRAGVRHFFTSFMLMMSRLLYLLLLLCAIGGGVHAQMADTLRGQVIHWSNSLSLHGYTSDSTYLNFTAGILGPGVSDGVQITSMDQLVIIKEGQVTASLNGEKKTLGPGGLVLCLAGDKATIENNGPDAAVYYTLFFKPAKPQQGATAGKSLSLDWPDLPVQTNPRGEVRQVFSEPTTLLHKIDMHATTLNAGQMPHPAHTHPQAELILILSGNLTMQIGNTFYPAQTGDIALFTSLTPHGVKNTGAAAARYFALQWE